MVSLVSSIWTPATIVSVLAGFWVLVMISVPIIRWVAGAGAERVGIASGVFAQVAVVLVALASTLGWFTLVVVVLIPVLGWASEVLGSKTGIPFGDYHYTDVLQPQVAHVPVLIPLAWLMMMPPAWAVAAVVAPDMPLAQWAIAAAAFTAWDVYLDPLMVRWDFWRWKRGGAYLGIPLVNYVGWFIVAFAITAVLSLIAGAFGIALFDGIPHAPLVLVFLVTWLLQFVGQFIFWNLRASALAGFVAMGLFAAALIVRLGW